MLFNSLAFAVFFPVVYTAYRLLPHRGQNILLLAASYVFYGSWDWRFLSLILISTAVDYGCGRAMHRAANEGRRRRLLLMSLVVNLGLLGVFKYFNFFAESFASLLAGFGMQADVITLNVILPVGISFYTFQTLSYTIDIYRKELDPEPDPINFALFVAFFPQLVAGPIERASRLLPQVRAPRRITAVDVETGLWLVLWGYFLKVFVADNLAPIANTVFGGEGPYSGVEVTIGLYAFAFQIFGDFAGYSSIAIGISSLMGFHLTTNFLFPYFVTNPRDFWRNWHISLSTWLRDYLYIPLGGSQGSTGMVYRNLMLTMLLGGLWHGAAWTFVVWGAFHGALLVAHRLIEASPLPRLRFSNRLQRDSWFLVKMITMFQLTCLGWLLFRAQSMQQVFGMLRGLAVWTIPSEQVALMVLQVVFFTWLTVVVLWIHSRHPEDATPIDRLSNVVRVPVLLLIFYSVLIWGSFGGQPFIYFQF